MIGLSRILILIQPNLTYIKENKEVFSTALNNGKSLGFEKVYNRMFEHIFNPILEKFNYPAGVRKYVIIYYLNGVTAVVSEWLKDNCEKSVSDISNIIKDCIFGLDGSVKTPFSK